MVSLPDGLCGQVVERAGIRVGVLIEQLAPCAGFAQQTVAPALRPLEALQLRIMLPFAGLERRQHWLRIDASHELADVLPLPELRTVGGQALQVFERRGEPLRQLERVDVLLLELRQLHAKILQLGRLALARALAR